MWILRRVRIPFILVLIIYFLCSLRASRALAINRSYEYVNEFIDLRINIYNSIVV